MTDVASLALKVDSTQVVTADKNLDTFAGTAKDAGDSALAASKKSGKLTNTMNQLGFQLQDVAVQAQAGINGFTIFAQQGSQLFSAINPLLGLAAALAGVLGGVLFTALGAASDGMTEFGEDIQAAEQDIISFTESLRALSVIDFQRKQIALSEAIEEANTELRRAQFLDKANIYQDLSENTREAETAVSDLENQMAMLNNQYEFIAESTADLSNNQEELDRDAKKLTSTLIKLESQQEREAKRIEKTIERYETLSATVGMTRAETIRYNAAIQAQNIESEEQRERLLAAADAYAKNIEEQEKLTEAQKAAKKEVKELEKEQDKLTDTISSGLAEAIQGYKTFGDVVLSVLDDIASALIQQNITDPLVDIFSGAASSGGSSGSSESSFLGDLFGSIFSPNAKGGVINEAGVVGTQGGKLAVAGEAGPEAILPLSRGSGGELGVKAMVGGGSNVVVNVINESGSDTDISESQGADGERIVNVTVLKAVKNALSTGTLDRDFKTNFGLARQGT
jgi:hypothetical protein